MSDFDEQQLYSIKQRLEMRERQIDAVHRISAALYSKNDLDSLLRETLHVALETVEADAGSIYLFDNEKRKLVFHYVTGEKAAELTGSEIDPDHPQAISAAVFRSRETILTPDPRPETYDSEFDKLTGFQTKSLITVPLKSSGGEPIGVLQALNKRADHFNSADQELLEIVSSLAATSIVNARLAEEAQLAAVARAVGELAHDIKNALTPIETAMETLALIINTMFADIDKLMAPDAPDAQAVMDATLFLRELFPEMRAAAIDGSADIKEMVSEIADYIKGTQVTRMEAGNVETVIAARLDRLRVVARDRRVTLHSAAQTAVPEFLFDRRLLGRAIYNLVNNALGAVSDAVKKREIELPPDGFNVWVNVSAVTEGVFPAGNYCLIEVRDDGPGIRSDVLTTLFSAKGAKSTTPGGTGIGTGFVKKVADAHGGEVGVESEPDCGARFWLKLPLKGSDE